MTATTPADYDYPSPELTECPYGFYEALREQAPVHRLETGEFVLSRWDDVVAAARDTSVFSSNLTLNAPELQAAYPQEEQPAGSPYTPWPSVYTDPPEHRLKRSLALPIISRERLVAAEQIVRELADELIDRFVDRGHAEFRSELADPLPGRVMLRIIGLPREDEQQVGAWLGDHSMQTGLTKAAATADLSSGRIRAREYFKELLVERFERPQDDFVSDFARAKAERDGGELDLHWLASELTNLFGAATFTSSYMMTNALLLLLRHPAELERVSGDENLLRSAIEESLRFESPVQWTPRYVTEDTSVQGVSIPQGSVVLLAWGAANRDPRKFEDADRFVIDRERVAKEQLAFGFGAHLCLGAPIARVETRVTLERLFARLNGLRLSDENDFEYESTAKFRSPIALHIEFARA